MSEPLDKPVVSGTLTPGPGVLAVSMETVVYQQTYERNTQAHLHATDHRKNTVITKTLQ